jgi:16S rRNA (uracil1498-N3)-methyltransferase
LASYDFTARRLFVAADLGPGAAVDLGRDQSNYLRNVLRLESGARVLVFNGRDGEWRARLDCSGKRDAKLVAEESTRAQPPARDLHLLFAPLKHARLDYMVQKAVEMGATRLRPVLTRRTQVQRVNLERMRANAIEAAEQCGVLVEPDVAEPQRFEAVVGSWPATRLLIFCDEDAEPGNPVALLSKLPPTPELAVIIGPEGGFDDEERAKLNRLAMAARISLGPRILRADTAAVAALAVAQAALGDWESGRG